eukprot:Skav222376  [mRNA]  locus=scaffold2692:243349:248473:- [translate_table: standard]
MSARLAARHQHQDLLPPALRHRWNRLCSFPPRPPKKVIASFDTTTFLKVLQMLLNQIVRHHGRCTTAIHLVAKITRCAGRNLQGAQNCLFSVGLHPQNGLQVLFGI